MKKFIRISLKVIAWIASCFAALFVTIGVICLIERQDENYNLSRKYLIGEHLKAKWTSESTFSIVNTKTGKTTVRNIEYYSIMVSKRDSLYAFQSKYNWGFYNAFTGELAVKPQYSKVWSFSNGLAAVRKDGMVGFIDHQGRVVIGFNYPAYKEPGLEYKFKYGYCVVPGDTGHLGVIDKSGNWVIEPKYEDIVLDKKYALVSAPGIGMQVGYDGEIMNDFLVDCVMPLTYSKLAKEDEDGPWEYPDFETGYYIYCVGGLYGLMDSNHKILTKPIYTHIEAADAKTIYAELSDANMHVLLDLK